MRIPATSVLFLCLSFFFASCKEDPAKVSLCEKQKLEIIQLKGEIAVIEEKIKNTPEDVSGELLKTQKEIESRSREITELEKELAELDAKKRALQTDFDKYRAKFPIK